MRKLVPEAGRSAPGLPLEEFCEITCFAKAQGIGNRFAGQPGVHQEAFGFERGSFRDEGLRRRPSVGPAGTSQGLWAAAQSPGVLADVATLEKVLADEPPQLRHAARMHRLKAAESAPARSLPKPEQKGVKLGEHQKVSVPAGCVGSAVVPHLRHERTTDRMRARREIDPIGEFLELARERVLVGEQGTVGSRKSWRKTMSKPSHRSAKSKRCVCPGRSSSRVPGLAA